ncbi:albusnodin family lasso peptide [Streptomyces sp. MP131-18]|nr:albusnodin family lasso peptide [Streptomyces sp. MP131-18]ONK13226.1 hypothetical protein STBA_39890 [Streptomyces sp. MP131-18]
MNELLNTETTTIDEELVEIGDATTLTRGGDGFGRENKRRIYG